MKEVKHRSRRAAALLAIAFGLFGAHKFYIGKRKAGLAHIIALFVGGFLASIIGYQLPLSLIGIFGCVEGVLYALMTNEKFDERYVYGEREFL